MTSISLSAPLEQQLPALRQRLMRRARMALADRGAAEDLVQDTLLAVLESESTRRGEATLTTWATSILKHKVADWYRAPARRRMVPLTEEDERLGETVDAMFDEQGAHVEPVSAWQRPDQQAESRQMMSALTCCVDELPSQTGRVFMMREWLGFETAEIAERLGVTADNCRQLLHRARMGLRACMDKRWFNAPARH